MKQADQLHRFLFENSDVRGNTVHLSDTIQQALQHHDYPPVLRHALGELMAAAALLTATVKLDKGLLSFQIQGKGPLSLLVVECNAALKMRATAKWQGDIDGLTFQQMIGNGHFAITLDPRDGGQTYQGIVDLVGDSIAEILQNYMQQSAQLETKLWLTSNQHQAAGLLLQKLPQKYEHSQANVAQSADSTQIEDEDIWQRTTMLADTLQSDELMQLESEQLLTRLFHQETVRLFDPSPVCFECRCSPQSVSNMLRLLGREEIESILQEQGKVTVHCDFCYAAYVFDAVDARQLFTSDSPPQNSTRLH